MVKVAAVVAQAAGGGAYGTIEKIACCREVNASYVGRLLGMTLLAPGFVEAALDCGSRSR